MSDNIAQLVPSKSDHDLAAAYKAEIAEAHKVICDLYDRMNADGFSANLQIGLNAFGKHQIMHVQLVKVF